MLQLPISSSIGKEITPQGKDLAPPPAGYQLLHLRVTIRSRHLLNEALVLSFGAENLLNTSYRSYQNQFRYFSEEPGRNLWIQITYTR